MLIGTEPSIQAALLRLRKPAAAGGWVSQRARELAQDHQIWLVNEPPETFTAGSALASARQFALGFRLVGETGLDAEVRAASEPGANQIAAWFEQIKTSVPEKYKPALDSITMERSGAVVRFATHGDALFKPENAPATADLGVELYGLIASGFPGVPARAISREKLSAVKVGMKREEVLSLLGKPLSVSGIQGLEVPRESWVYQLAFGKRQTIRLVDGVVTVLPDLSK